MSTLILVKFKHNLNENFLDFISEKIKILNSAKMFKKNQNLYALFTLMWIFFTQKLMICNMDPMKL
jgi:hypothetical protein